MGQGRKRNQDKISLGEEKNEFSKVTIYTIYPNYLG